MSEVNLPGDKLQPVVTAAHRVLDAYGGLETSDSPRVMYTKEDLNIARGGRFRNHLPRHARPRATRSMTIQTLTHLSKAIGWKRSSV